MPIQGETIFIAILVLALFWVIYRSVRRNAGGGDASGSGGQFGDGGDGGDGGGGDGGGGGD